MPGTEEGPIGQPEGWYADPFGRRRLRWWDGETWSAYAGDGVAVEWDPEPTEEVVPRSPGLPGVGAALVGTAIGLGLGFAVGALVDGDDAGGRVAELGLSSLGLWAGLIGACVYVSRRRGTGSLVRDFGFRFRWADVGLGLAGAVVGRIVAAIMLAPIPFPTRSLNEVDREVLSEGIHGTGAWLVLVAVTCLGAPLVEELFFRGLLQTRLVGRFGPVPGIVATSLLFGSAHLIAWEGAITLAYGWSIAGGGLVLGIVFHVSGRLGTPIAAHAFFNSIAMLALAALS